MSGIDKEHVMRIAQSDSITAMRNALLNVSDKYFLVCNWANCEDDEPDTRFGEGYDAARRFVRELIAGRSEEVQR